MDTAEITAEDWTEGREWKYLGTVAQEREETFDEIVERKVLEELERRSLPPALMERYVELAMRQILSVRPHIAAEPDWERMVRLTLEATHTPVSKDMVPRAERPPTTEDVRRMAGWMVEFTQCALLGRPSDEYIDAVYALSVEVENAFAGWWAKRRRETPAD
jgi:hypothetical protein